MLTLKLQKIEIDGIYGAPPHLPDRAKLLHPDAAGSLAAYFAKNGMGVASDVFRSPEESLQAMLTKAGVQPPGWSAHNFGLAIDWDVEQMLKRLSQPYWAFLAGLEEFGWFCHRRDGKRGSEDWHTTFGQLSHRVDPANPQTWASVAEDAILRYYGDSLYPSGTDLQESLKALGLYSGPVDRLVGPQTMAAVRVFGAKWRIAEKDMFMPFGRRTLAIVSAQKEIA